MSWIFWLIGTLGFGSVFLFAAVLVPMVLGGMAPRTALWIGAAIVVVLLGGAAWRGLNEVDTLYTRLDKAQREAATAKDERDTALGAAKTCSDSVRALADAGAQRASAAEPARQQAQQRAQQHTQRAGAIIATQPAVPNDDAASARQRIDAWLRARGQ